MKATYYGGTTLEFTRKWNKRLSGQDKVKFEIHINGTMVKKYRITHSPLKRELVFYKDYGEKVNKLKVMDELFQQNGCFYA